VPIERSGRWHPSPGEGTAGHVHGARVDLRRGGCAAFLPDETPETYAPVTEHGGSDDDLGRGVRYLEWSWDPDPDDSITLTDYAIITRDASGEAQVRHDRHETGLFSRADWMDLLGATGLEGEHIVDGVGRDVFIGRSPER
jgi:hypothetical protein